MLLLWTCGDEGWLSGKLFGDFLPPTFRNHMTLTNKKRYILSSDTPASKFVRTRAVGKNRGLQTYFLIIKSNQ